MKKLRKMSVFLLFFVLFLTVACSIFSAQVKERVVNCFTGGGERAYLMAVPGEKRRYRSGCPGAGRRI